MESPKLTDAQWRGLMLLGQMNKREPLVRTNNFGMEMWADLTDAYGYKGSNCSAPFARPAGRLLKSLEKRGLVKYHVWDDPKDWGWRITVEGQALLHPVVLATEMPK